MDAGRLPLPYQGGLDYQTALKKREKGEKKTQLYTEDVMYMCARHTKISKGFFDWELGGALHILQRFFIKKTTYRGIKIFLPPVRAFSVLTLRKHAHHLCCRSI